MRETDLAAYAHQDLPFERLVEQLNPARSLARHPAVPGHAGAAEQCSRPASTCPASRASPLAVGTGTAKFDLGFGFAERRGADGTPQGLDGIIEYASDLFDKPTVGADRPAPGPPARGGRRGSGQRIGAIEILSAEERHRILEQWNDTARPVAQATLPQLFEAQVAQTPDATALVFEEQSLSYAELDARANRLAHHLIGRGAGPETIVGLCLERSPEMVVALLAILKAGAAYLPLDPDYPAERLAFMLDDARPLCVLTAGTAADRLPGTATAAAARRPGAPGRARQPSDTAPADRDRRQPLVSGHPAYLIYTSGSTGTPKGVAVSHRGLVNTCCWMKADHPA